MGGQNVLHFCGNVIPGIVCPPGSLEPASTDSSNVLLLQGLENMRLDYMPTDISPNAQDKPMFTGSFSEMWRSIGRCRRCS